MQTTDWRQRVPLGKTGMLTSRIGLASSYGIGAREVEAAYNEHGINYLYWGSLRRESFGAGIRNLAGRKREDLVIVLQSYSRLAGWLKRSFERGLQRLRLEYADILLLGMHNHPPSKRVMDAAMQLRTQGKARFLAVSCHKRATFRRYIDEGMMDVLMFRYNAAHRGAETEILPLLTGTGRPGTVGYTATRWGNLIHPRRIPKGEAVPSASDCYRFVLTQPDIDVCLSGPADGEQWKESMATLDRGPMSEEELAWMRRIGDHIHRSASH